MGSDSKETLMLSLIAYKPNPSMKDEKTLSDGREQEHISPQDTAGIANAA